MPISHWIYIVFFGLFGATSGSFIGVLIYRMPRGISVVWPASFDAETGRRLAWWENIPVLSFLMLRGRSRYSGKPIGWGALALELFVGAAFVGLGWWYFGSGYRPAFQEAGPLWTLPVFLLHLVLVGAMVAATLIDARYFIIPLGIPWFVTLLAVVLLPLVTAVGWIPEGWPTAATVGEQMVPVVGPVGLGAAAGGLLGLAIAVVLLRFRVIPLSFAEPVAQAEAVAETPLAEVPENSANVPGADTGQPVVIAPDPAGGGTAHLDAGLPTEGPEQWLAHPHPRREIAKELLFLVWPSVGILLGLFVGLQVETVLPGWLAVLGGVVCGYLVGGGLVWGIRVLGTLAFGKEAMGLGDVHLLAAIGAVLGAADAALVFFIAPFFGLLAALGLMVASLFSGGRVRAIPYGPHLCAAAVLVMMLRGMVLSFFVNL